MEVSQWVGGYFDISKYLTLESLVRMHDYIWRVTVVELYADIGLPQYNTPQCDRYCFLKWSDIVVPSVNVSQNSALYP